MGKLVFPRNRHQACFVAFDDELFSVLALKTAKEVKKLTAIECQLELATDILLQLNRVGINACDLDCQISAIESEIGVRPVLVTPC